MVEKGLRLEANVEGQLKTRKLGGILKSRTPAKSLDTVPEYATASHLERRSNSFISEGNEENQAPTTAPNEEQRKFNTLCEGVQSCLALFQTSMAELLELKDELLKHALPPTVLLKITLVSAKLFRSASDLNVPISELVRLVKLYSAPWETKSAALKKLHEDYENKQRQLNVALQKLVLVGIQSDRMAKERRVLNWERLFSRMMTSKAHGYRWKFLIESFKQKAKTGEVFAAGSSTDEEEVAKQRKSAARLDAIRRRSMNQRVAANSPTKSILQGSIKGSVSTDSTTVTGEWKKETDNVLEEEEEDLSEVDLDFKDLNLDEGENSSWPSRDLSQSKPRSGTSSEKTKTVQIKASRRETRPKAKFFDAGNDEETEDESTESPVKSPIPVKFRFSPIKKPESPPKKPTRIQFDEKNTERSRKKRPHIRFAGGADDEEKETKTDIIPSQPQAPPVVKVDQACWTEEPDCERYLHVRLFRPVCLKADSPYCTLTLGEQLFKSEIFPEPLPSVPVESPDDSANNEKKDEKSKEGLIKQKSSNRTSAVKKTGQTSPTPPPTSPADSPPPQFEEFVFKLPDTNGYSLGEKIPDIGEEQLKIAVHPAHNAPMIALASVKYNELKIKDAFEGRWSHTNEAPAGDAQQLPLFSVVTMRDIPFNSDCGHVPVVCYESKVEKPKKLTKETDTMSFEELVNEEIAERRRAEEEKSNEVPQPQYTEGDLNALRNQHAEEIQMLQNEFELRLTELSKGVSGPFTGGTGFEPTLISAATSPIFMRSPSPTGASQSQQGKTPRPPSEARGTLKRHRPKIANLPEWGKDLPQDFLVRLQMFAENSEKYRQELGEKTKRAIQEKYEQQMAVHNRLDVVDGDEMLEDVCLPAVFMPTRTGHVYTPKAHSYFHPPGSSEVRLTQPPSMFKLPSISPESQVSVLNLFDMGKTFLNTGPRWSWGEDDSRPHTTSEPRVNEGFPSATMGMHHSPSPHFDRSKTR